MKIPTFSYFFDLSYYLTPCWCKQALSICTTHKGSEGARKEKCFALVQYVLILTHRPFHRQVEQK